MRMSEIRGARFISIHAPREGGDGGISTKPKHGNLFQSTPPARGATVTPP